VRRVGTTYQATYKLPEDFGAQTAVINAILHLQLGSTDVSSSPTAIEVRVQTPLGFPTISPEILHLSSVEGVGISRGVLTVTGDPQFAGRACLTVVDYPTLPPVAASQLAATHNKCVNVRA